MSEITHEYQNAYTTDSTTEILLTVNIIKGLNFFQTKKIQVSLDMSIYEIKDLIEKKALVETDGYGLFFPGDENNLPCWLEPLTRPIRNFLVSSDSNWFVECRPYASMMKVLFADDAERTWVVDYTLNVDEIIRFIGDKMELKHTEPFGLCKAMDNGGHWLAPEFYKGSAPLYAQGFKYGDRIVFTERYHGEVLDLDDPVLIHLIYVQSVKSIIEDTCPCDRPTAVTLSALQAVVEFGQTKLNSIEIEKYTAKSYQRDKKIMRDILTEYSRSILSPEAAKIQYIEIVRSLPMFGYTFFPCHIVKVSPGKKPKLGKKILCGMNRDNLNIIDYSSKKQIEKVKLTQIKSYRVIKSENVFKVDLERSSIFLQSDDVYLMYDLVSGYINLIAQKLKLENYEQVAEEVLEVKNSNNDGFDMSSNLDIHVVDLITAANSSKAIATELRKKILVPVGDKTKSEWNEKRESCIYNVYGTINYLFTRLDEIETMKPGELNDHAIDIISNFYAIMVATNHVALAQGSAIDTYILDKTIAFADYLCIFFRLLSRYSTNPDEKQGKELEIVEKIFSDFKTFFDCTTRPKSINESSLTLLNGVLEETKTIFAHSYDTQTKISKFLLNPVHKKIFLSSVNQLKYNIEWFVLYLESVIPYIKLEGLFDSILYCHESIKEILEAQIDIVEKSKLQESDSIAIIRKLLWASKTVDLLFLSFKVTLEEVPEGDISNVEVVLTFRNTLEELSTVDSVNGLVNTIKTLAKQYTSLKEFATKNHTGNLDVVEQRCILISTDIRNAMEVGREAFASKSMENVGHRIEDILLETKSHLNEVIESLTATSSNEILRNNVKKFIPSILPCYSTMIIYAPEIISWSDNYEIAFKYIFWDVESLFDRVAHSCKEPREFDIIVELVHVIIQQTGRMKEIIECVTVGMEETKDTKLKEQIQYTVNHACRIFDQLLESVEKIKSENGFFFEDMLNQLEPLAFPTDPSYFLEMGIDSMNVFDGANTTSLEDYLFDDSMLASYADIKYISMRKLIAVLTSCEEDDYHGIEVFLLMYYKFMSPEDLLEALFLRFAVPAVPHLAPIATIIRKRTFAMIKCWIERYKKEDFKSQEMKDKLLAWLDDNENQIEEVDSLHVKSIINGTSEFIEYENKPHERLERPETIPPITERSDISSYTVLDFNPEEVARQLCLLTMKELRRIRPREYTTKVWNSIIDSPNVMSNAFWFNKISNWATEMILHPDVQTRIDTLEAFIHIAYQSYKYKNYFVTMALCASFSNAAIFRLKYTFQNISDTHKQLLEEINEVASTDGNYSNLRKELERNYESKGTDDYAPMPLIPFLGIIQTDLTFLEDGIPTKFNDSLICWSKQLKLAKSILAMHDYQKIPYNFAVVEDIQNYLIQIDIDLEMNELYELSKNLEPKDYDPGSFKPKKKKTKTLNIQKPNEEEDAGFVLNLNISDLNHSSGSLRLPESPRKITRIRPISTRKFMIGRKSTT
eukprot:TRINITY_DN8556_c0_g1_i1.p1 TRINITY_DN8556_c0_g1~~TRINITY_DN8556_c0_g1_i1.p1  ORF type:complete len:1481 (-),score=313.09 TRINITY_DN8556_c0_g1_i1:134-4576(-)